MGEVIFNQGEEDQGAGCSLHGEILKYASPSSVASKLFSLPSPHCEHLHVSLFYREQTCAVLFKVADPSIVW